MAFILFRDAQCGRPTFNYETDLDLGYCLNIAVGSSSLTITLFPGCPNSGTPLLLMSNDTGCPGFSFSPTITSLGTATHSHSTSGSPSGAALPLDFVNQLGVCQGLRLGTNIGSVQFACPALTAAPAPTATSGASRYVADSRRERSWISGCWVLLGGCMALGAVIRDHFLPGSIVLKLWLTDCSVTVALDASASTGPRTSYDDNQTFV
ncbi:uncharacterized protein BCR38DRAFT_489315 [Pseudomassariella vexata]|uniref:Uncharacterized protein n=1 Tax=Pseudomassariella vexata TaxID=1141098 RepID=A0A1Y2DGH9_9PEZI|nr:uncharacterized protein BCR38DRAFT_489315 [Pseudomassariella vexata]ORY58391.1 hypothetical protein BCR38DRAFT_489315 [Pseudomassariella vexata]